MSDSKVVVVKTVFSGEDGKREETRRFQLYLDAGAASSQVSSSAPLVSVMGSETGLTPYQQILHFLSDTYPSIPAHKRFVLKYIDDDKDVCSISSDMELSEAIRVSGGKTLKLLVSVEDMSSVVSHATNSATTSSTNMATAQATIPSANPVLINGLSQESDISIVTDTDIDIGEMEAAVHAAAVHAAGVLAAADDDVVEHKQPALDGAAAAALAGDDDGISTVDDSVFDDDDHESSDSDSDYVHLDHDGASARGSRSNSIHLAAPVAADASGVVSSAASSAGERELVDESVFPPSFLVDGSIVHTPAAAALAASGPMLSDAPSLSTSLESSSSVSIDVTAEAATDPLPDIIEATPSSPVVEQPTPIMPALTVEVVPVIETVEEHKVMSPRAPSPVHSSFAVAEPVVLSPISLTVVTPVAAPSAAAPAPAVVSPVSLVPAGAVCPQCTFINDEKADVCEICLTKLPLSDAILAAAPLPEPVALPVAMPVAEVKQEVQAEPQPEFQPEPQPEVKQDTEVEQAPIAANAVAPVYVHEDVSCDGCGMFPLVGPRFKCTVCANYDLCEQCEEREGIHDPDHTMLKIKAPVSGPVAMPRYGLDGERKSCDDHHGQSRGARRGKKCGKAKDGAAKLKKMHKPKAEFVNDVTIEDGYQIDLGTVQTVNKVWSLRNSGKADWPAGCALRYIKGQLFPHSLDDQEAFFFDVPPVQRDCIVHISVDIQIPQKVGRYRGVYRLVTPFNKRFGPRMWVDVRVVEPKPAVPALTVDILPQALPQDAAPATPVEVVASVAPSAPIALEEEIKQAPQVQPVAVPIVPASAPQLLSASPMESKDMQESKHVQQQVATSPAVTSSSSSDPSAFKYAMELEALTGMGFGSDQELLKYMLVNNKGDVNKVVAWLLANGSF